MDVRLTKQREQEAALRLLKKAIRRHGGPEKSTIDGSAANEAAIKSDNEEHGTAIAIRQITPLNNIVEQDHRAVKRVTRLMLGCKAFEAAQCTLASVEFMHMIKKRQMGIEEGEESLTAAEQFYALAASSLHRQGQLPRHNSLSKICDRALGITVPRIVSWYLNSTHGSRACYVLVLLEHATFRQHGEFLG